MAVPDISVVIPLYNKAQSIRKTLESVFAQNNQRFELLVIDDGSTDGSVNVVRNIQDSRLRLISQPNGGVSSARNTGLHEARFDHVAFLDADDLWAPDYLSEQAKLATTFPKAALWATGYAISSDTGQSRPRLISGLAERSAGPMPDFFQAAIHGAMPFFTSSVMVSRSTALTSGGFAVGVCHAEDLDMWARLALAGEVVYSPEARAIYRTESENRAMRRFPAMTPWVFRSTVDRLVTQGKVGKDLAKDLEEFCARVDLYHAHGNLLNPDRKQLTAFISTIKTKNFRHRILIYKIISYLPVKIARLAIRAIETIR